MHTPVTVARHHPRYIITLALVLSFTLLYYISNTESFNRFTAKVTAVQPLSAYERIMHSEDLYQKFLKDREQLIVKLGPTKEEVDGWPTKEPNMHTLWDFFIPAFQCPWGVRRVGTLGDGGKWVCGVERIARQKKCVIYSFGINKESSFEADFLKIAPGCEVWGYDFSVSSFGPEITGDSSLTNRSHFFAYALGAADIAGPLDNPKTYTLSTLMAQNGHTFVDVLKIDIEGHEFPVLEQIVHQFPAELPFGQLQLEIHAQYDLGRFARFLPWWEALERAGLRPFWLEPNLVYLNIMRGAVRADLMEYAYLNIGRKHSLTSDDYVS